MDRLSRDLAAKTEELEKINERFGQQFRQKVKEHAGQLDVLREERKQKINKLQATHADELREQKLLMGELLQVWNHFPFLYVHILLRSS